MSDGVATGAIDRSLTRRGSHVFGVEPSDDAVDVVVETQDPVEIVSIDECDIRRIGETLCCFEYLKPASDHGMFRP
ncbi:MAG: hypothetical protein ABEI11_02050, partial [Haloarculaceae archaeon]